MSNVRVHQYRPGRVGPGNDCAETMSVTSYSANAKKVAEDVQRLAETGWANAEEKKVRGAALGEILTMASVVRYQTKAIAHGGMSGPLKDTISPPSYDPRLMGQTQPVAEYIKTSFRECKDQLLIQQKEIKVLRRALREISKKIKTESDSLVEETFSPASFWNDEAEMGKILGELDLDDEEEE